MTMTPVNPNAATTDLDDEVAATPAELAADEAWTNLVQRLSQQSVVKHFETYTDIAWDDPEMQIDPHDPRWELSEDNALGATSWYRALPQEVRARMGLAFISCQMKSGLQFESILKRGLLEFAAKLPNNTPEYRYAYHEVIEEAYHSLMFQEFVNRSGFSPKGLGWQEQFGARRVIGHGRRFPELFFIFVLGGEDPIDHVQREALRDAGQGRIHPLLERIMRIHVTEEARHLSFARQYLKRNVPKLSRVRRLVLSIGAPLILEQMARLMMQAPSQIVKEFGIPAEVLREAYTDNAEHKVEVAHSLRKVRQLCIELGLVNPVSKRLWMKAGIWAD
jgi:hypothetical protein